MDAHFLLGLTYSNAGNYKESIDQLNAVKKVKAEQAPTLFLALAS